MKPRFVNSLPEPKKKPEQTKQEEVNLKTIDEKENEEDIDELLYGDLDTPSPKRRRRL